jgi:hypothetical protein
LLTPESQDAAAAGDTKKFTIESTGDYTAASALLDYISINANKPLTSAAIGSYRTDVGRRPGAIGMTSSGATATAAALAMYNGKYNFDEDPAKILVFFGAYTGNYKFMPPASVEGNYLKMIINGDAFTTDIYVSMTFPNNCYKIIVYGKNTAGKVIGKYVGYSTGKTYDYWCISPENANYGKSGAKNL